MFESRYSKVLTVVLVIIIIAIVGLLGFLAYDYIKKSNNTKQASEFVENYEGDISTGDNSEQENEIGNVVLDESLQEELDKNTSGNSRKKRYGPNGEYTVAGTIKIPSINVNYPILEEPYTEALDIAVALIHPGDAGERLNKPGNVVIAGHNYRNGTLFSNVKKLSNGAKIIITDYTGKTLTYEVYNKFEANEIDTSFYDRDTNGLAEVTLSTCTDASNDIRTIVFAKQI